TIRQKDAAMVHGTIHPSSRVIARPLGRHHYCPRTGRFGPVAEANPSSKGHDENGRGWTPFAKLRHLHCAKRNASLPGRPGTGRSLALPLGAEGLSRQRRSALHLAPPTRSVSEDWTSLADASG